ncbi:MAG TPA: hypothetical protein VJG90_01330 [Candidatus Nanoarchaeia archaeon]|nr:hypothetical protein [Candidatus Nanoarchaeia archaeon]
MADSVFRSSIDFFGQIGIYDVVLPFLLVFTIVFAILEKTKIFGTEKGEHGEVTKKNLNAMVAFVSAFFVVASSQLVAAINQTVGHTFLLLLLSVLFLMLVGSFHTGGKEFELPDKWKWPMMWVMFIGIVLIFFNALGWLDLIYSYLTQFWDSVAVSSVLLVIVFVALIAYITKSPKPDKPKEG